MSMYQSYQQTTRESIHNESNHNISEQKRQHLHSNEQNLIEGEDNDKKGNQDLQNGQLLDQNDDQHEDSMKINVNNNSPINDYNLLKTMTFNICQKAKQMLRNQLPCNQIAEALKIKQSTVQKMKFQLTNYGKIYPPIRYDPKGTNSNTQYLSPITPNMKVNREHAGIIKDILYLLVREGKMQSLDQFQKYLLKMNIRRSLSSVYRYINNIKINNPQFQNRTYPMYNKQLETTLSNGNIGTNESQASSCTQNTPN